MTSATERLLPCPFCGNKDAPEQSSVYDFEECNEFDDCEWRETHNTCEGCDEVINPMSVVCNYRNGGCGSCGPYRKTSAEAIAAWNTRATHGTLTAEQVREAIERHSAWVIGNNRCFHDGAYEAIADELNATLGSERGTCHIVKETKTIRSLLHGEVEVTDERCSECRGFMDVGRGVYRNFCPNCGRRAEHDRD